MNLTRHLAAKLLSGSFLLLAATSVGASPSRASSVPYGGIGATLADFAAAHPDGPGKPPAGTTYYHIDSTRSGRVIGYHVVIGWPTHYRPYVDLRRLTGRELPADAHLVKPYNGYCAIYRSRWLGRRVQAMPYIIVYAPTRAAAKRRHFGGQWNGVSAQVDPACRG